MRIDLGRDKLRELSEDLLARTRECMERCVADAGLGWPAIDSSLLVGGSSRMAVVRELARSVSGTDPSVDVNPDECVALGAALRAHLADVAEQTAERAARPRAGGGAPVGHEHRDPRRRSAQPRRACPHGPGPAGQQHHHPAADDRPCDHRRTYATRVDNQQAIEVEILQGEAPDPFSPEVEAIGRVRIDELPARPAGGVVIAVALRYDADGVVEVVAEELIEGRSVRQQLLRKSGELDRALVESLKDRLERMMEEPEPVAEEPEVVAAGDGDLYSLLGLARDADPAEIDAAIRRCRDELADVAARDPDETVRARAEEQLAAVDEAHLILLDPAERAEYDALHEQPEDGETPEDESSEEHEDPRHRPREPPTRR